MFSSQQGDRENIETPVGPTSGVLLFGHYTGAKPPRLRIVAVVDILTALAKFFSTNSKSTR